MLKRLALSWQRTADMIFLNLPGLRKVRDDLSCRAGGRVPGPFAWRGGVLKPNGDELPERIRLDRCGAKVRVDTPEQGALERHDQIHTTRETCHAA